MFAYHRDKPLDFRINIEKYKKEFLDLVCIQQLIKVKDFSASEVDEVAKHASYFYSFKNHYADNCNIEFFYYDSFKFLNDFNSKVDILFSDAPFNVDISKEVFEKFEKVTNEIIITETLYKNVPLDRGTSFNLIKRYRYGRISLNVYRNKKV